MAFLNYVMYSDSVDNLKYFSNLCPFEYGPSVYLARSLLKSIDLDSNFDEAELCGEIEPRSYKESKIELTGNHNVFIYPNPLTFNDKLTVVGVEIDHVEVYDLFGELIFSSYLKEQSFTLPSNIRSPGVFLLKVYNPELIENTFKIVVVD